MEESELVSFFMWSVITGVVMLVTGISYRAYSKKNKIASS